MPLLTSPIWEEVVVSIFKIIVKSELFHLIKTFQDGENVPPVVVDVFSIPEIIQVVAGVEIMSLDDLSEMIIPHVFVWRQTDRNVLIRQAKDIITKVYLHASPDHGAIFIVEGIDHFTIEAANSLLKLFEEPPAGALFVLTAESIERILPTVRSRVIVFAGGGTAQDLPRDIREQIEGYCLGDRAPFLAYLYHAKFEREEYIAILSVFLDQARAGNLRDVTMIERIDRALTTIFTTNTNARPILDTIFFCPEK